MTRPRDIGTIGEGAVVRFLRAHGFPAAERRALAGTNDLGDITGCPGLVFEVKWGKAAEHAGPGQLESWLEETEVERRNAAAAHGILVVKRKGVGVERVGECHAWLWSDALAELIDHTGYGHPDAPVFPVRVTVADVVELLRWAGYGTPLARTVTAAA